MKPAFPTATTAPTTGKKDPMEQNQTNTNHNLIVFSKPSSMSPVSVHDVPVSTRALDEVQGADDSGESVRNAGWAGISHSLLRVCSSQKPVGDIAEKYVGSVVLLSTTDA
jgi:hypothetical protein